MKKVLIILGAIFLICVIGIGVFFYMIFPPRPSADKMIQSFERQKAHMYVIVDYLDEVPDYQEKIDSEGLHDSRDKTIVAIEDPEVEASIKYLLKTCGFQSIEKDPNSIHFTRWTTLDAGVGVVFAPDGDLSDLQLLTEIIPLSEDGWYYYEEDWNEYKRRLQSDKLYDLLKDLFADVEAPISITGGFDSDFVPDTYEEYMEGLRYLDEIENLKLLTDTAAQRLFHNKLLC